MKTIDKIAAETNALISELAVLMIGTVNDRARQLKFNAVHVKAEALKKEAQAITEILKTAYTITPVLKEEVVSVADPDNSKSLEELKPSSEPPDTIAIIKNLDVSPKELTDPPPEIIKKVKLDKPIKEHKGSKKVE